MFTLFYVTSKIVCLTINVLQETVMESNLLSLGMNKYSHRI